MEEFVVYILYSEKYDKIYVGYSSDIINRMKSHNIYSKKGYTLRFRPWKVIHIEFYQDQKLAMKREKWFKSGIGREFITMNIKK